MSTQSISIQSPNAERIPESAARRVRVRRRPAAVSPDRREATGQVGGARILRRWSVAELIARAGGAPRAFA